MQKGLFSEVSFHFKTKQTRKRKPQILPLHSSSLRLGNLLTATGVVGGADPSRGSTLVELEKNHAVSKKIE